MIVNYIILIIIAIIQNLVTQAGNQLIQIEKRTRDPTEPKEPKTNKEIGNRSTCAQVGGYSQIQM